MRDAVPLEIRRAESDDAAAIAHVKRMVWPTETTDLSQIARAIEDPSHVTFVAQVDGLIVGFVDGFVTVQDDGMRRWEVDLLGVIPECRGKRIGERLVQASTAAGAQRQVALARGLVHIQNVASQRTFARCGYDPDNTLLNLYISAESADGVPERSPSGSLIPVQTFNYRGLWIEGHLSEEAFLAAQAARARGNLDLVGALIPADQVESNAAAHASGFRRVGPYQWWRKDIQHSAISLTTGPFGRPRDLAV
jgi:ribosomal protein S18 acetylase RimI-like enzyme